ncbi:aldehyde dehydrogenase family protein [Flavobacterium sp. UBA6046]|jgi:succinate-semialdehyde dehydrogenase/glutarate-semialdehyde dehydrogenase|uniref:aldehyde dehydrogenase family protein n=1 Tax=Flavobacterium sp. UBA6046 TaxID=1946552 RepID=UPI0025BDF39C|nr:aldehyde dehydrogenase family protein [Flavobacterium sp. UBA6046]
MSFQTINPNTNKLVMSFEEMTDEAINNAVAQAEKAFSSWRKTGYTERSQLLNKVA